MALSYYGLCLAQIGELGRGLGVCERAVRHQPSDVMIRVNMGKVFRLAGDNHAAHRTFLRAWQVNRRHPAPAAELARMGIRRAPVLRFLPRSHWCNRQLGRFVITQWAGARRLLNPIRLPAQKGRTRGAPRWARRSSGPSSPGSRVAK